MTETDPHIHVEQRVIEAGAAVRNMIASTLGRAGDAPAVVSTGCGRQVPYAMTSPHPEKVTCLACREHAHRQYLRSADQIERLSRMPGVNITSDQAAKSAEWHRDLARRFSG
ncbi:hypothetical protein ABZ484_17610 [Streptomyces sp. NPDC006393]|uniref:hypothetical protein n=1 Tax=Streptomyces sp. NPDC006393 TaxID=3156763 RepID=UPI00340E6430